jgi:hypothetical protein
LVVKGGTIFYGGCAFGRKNDSWPENSHQWYVERIGRERRNLVPLLFMESGNRGREKE